MTARVLDPALLDQLPELYAPASSRSRRQRLSRAFRELTGASSCRIRSKAQPVSAPDGQELIRRDIFTKGSGSPPLEVQLYFEQGPKEGAMEVVDQLLPHARRILRLPASAPAHAPAAPRSAEIVTELRIRGRRAVVAREPHDSVVEKLGLSPRRSRVAELAGLGLSDRDIAARLGVSERTVANHLRAVFLSIGVQSRLALACRLMPEGGMS